MTVKWRETNRLFKFMVVTITLKKTPWILNQNCILYIFINEPITKRSFNQQIKMCILMKKMRRCQRHWEIS